ncbi:MAG: DUF3820 family protein [Anaerolineae bacterium]|nr:DUF3820 family protein [Anaerolineae bacterium]
MERGDLSPSFKPFCNGPIDELTRVHIPGGLWPGEPLLDSPQQKLHWQRQNHIVKQGWQGEIGQALRKIRRIPSEGQHQLCDEMLKECAKNHEKQQK